MQHPAELPDTPRANESGPRSRRLGRRSVLGGLAAIPILSGLTGSAASAADVAAGPRWRYQVHARYIRVLVASAALLVPAAVLGGGAAAASTTSPPALRDCNPVNIPVALAPGGPVSYQIYGEYCLPYGQQPSTIDIMVPGATYDHLYWDWPVNPSLYSFTDKTLAAGRAVLTIDRIGTGNSLDEIGTDTPLSSSQVTFAADVYTLHQMITWARDTARYSQVDVIGHSTGSLIAETDAYQYPSDPTRLVLTGLLNGVNPSLATFEADIEPANQDPVLAGTPLASLDPGFLTTDPGTRGQLFYWQNAAPRVVAYDEAHPNVFSATELGEISFPAAAELDLITVPVLMVVGQEDSLFCGGGAADCSSAAAVQALEQPYFTGSPSMTAIVIPDTGHDVALHPTTSHSFNEINRWIGTH